MIIRGYSAGLEENIKFPATLFQKNIEVLKEIMDAYHSGVRNLCFVGSSCMYPLVARQPYEEHSLGTGPVEPTSGAYAYAKLAGWQLCRAISEEHGVNYFTAIQADVYGELNSTHFIGQLIKKFHFAKEENQREVEVWGDGTAIREPLYIEDAKRALDFVIENHKSVEPINIGNGKEYSIFQVASHIKEVVGYEGTIAFDCAKPQGALRKTLNNSKLIELGFDKFTELRDGLEKAYSNFKNSSCANA